MPTEITKYKCSYCGKFEQRKIEHVERHEENCFYNPRNKACLTCKYSKRRLRVSEERDTYRGFVWECKKKKIKRYNLSSGYRVVKSVNVDENNNIIGKREMDGLFGYESTLVYPTRDCSEYEQKVIII